MRAVNALPGDKVEIELANEKLQGNLIESPDAEILLLKLKSGYNVGFRKENVLRLRVIERRKEQPKLKPGEGKKGLPLLGMVLTGGTIVSKLDSRTGAAAPLASVEELQEFYSDVFEMASFIIEKPMLMDSSAMGPSDWVKIAKVCAELLKKTEGVIVLHGTDSLHYTSSALSFYLQNLGKPVVLTFSQRSIDRGSSDARLNLACATKLALADVAGVMVVGHANTNDDFCYAHLGTKVRKLHTSRRDAFKSVNALPVAKLTPQKVEFISKPKLRTGENPALDVEHTDKVALVKYFPGQNPDVLDFYSMTCKGIVIEAMGLGHLPTEEATNNWIPKVKRVIKEGRVICITSQCIHGRVDPYVYSAGRALEKTGAIFLDDMLPETALVKLGWVLGHYGWKSKVREKMLTNFAGELNHRLVPELGN